MSNKTWRLSRYLFKDQLFYLGWSYLTIILVETLLPFGASLLSGTASTFSWRSHLSGLGIGAIFAFFVFIFSLQTYEGFKLFIQNGISRRTYLRARLGNLGLMSLLGVVLAVINDFAISAPLLRVDVFGLLARGPYEMYAKFFGNNVFATVLIYMLFLWIFYLTVGLFGIAVSSLLDLTTKTVRRVIYIVVPILGIFLIGFAASSSNNSPVSMGFVNFAKFLLGYRETLGLFNPFMPMLTMIVCGLIFGVIAYMFHLKLKVKN